MNLLYTLFAMSKVSPGSLPHKEAVGRDEFSTVLGIVFGIIGALAFLVMVIAGLRYIIAAGDPQKTANARNTIVFALVGIAIAVSAQAIVAFVVNRL
jgi:hypothetical protein